MPQITPNPGELRLATSRTGISIIDLRYQLPQRLFLAPKITVAFGSPKFGISELLSHETIKLNEVFDFNLNMLPWGQGTRTVRVEEALHVCLSLLWFLWEQDIVR